MRGDALTTVSASEVQPIKTILHNMPISPRTDDSKRRDKIINKKGELKVSKEPLAGRSLTLISLDRFTGKHYCGLCRTREKSQMVALVQDNFSGETFYMAKKCAWNHFGINLDKLATASGYSVSFFEKALQILGLQAIDNLEAVVGILANFDDLVSFPCKAVDEAKARLRAMYEDRGGLAVGQYDNDITDLETLVAFQYEYRHDRDHFEARWRALKTHPNRKPRQSRWRDALKIANPEERSDLTLSDFHAIREVLAEVHGSPVILRNPAVDPANFTNKRGYEDALAAHYQTAADILRDPKTNYHFVDQAPYLEHLDELVNEFPVILAISSYYPVKEKLEAYEVKNLDRLKKATNGQAQVYLSRDMRLGELKCRSKKEDSKGKYRTVTKKMYYIALAAWRPDGWQPTYNEWRKYGREKLETLPSDFRKH